jgi:phospholipase C
VATGQTVPLAPGPDIVPVVSHQGSGQVGAINGGQMNGFSKIKGCAAPTYSCYETYQQAAEPNVWALASKFAVSDRTFEQNPIPTWGAHVELVTSLLDGFQGDNPTGATGPGWGCDSGGVVNWSATGQPPYQSVPSCIPTVAGMGAFRATPVPWVPTIMDTLTTAGKSWKIYAASKTQGDYERAICPSFADCLDTSQVKNMVAASKIVTDAKAGKLPAFSILLPSSGPTGSTSEHNGQSMAVGDNWIGQVVSAIETGPNWNSTAIFLTWDDCGCFYDHVPPPTGTKLGIRVPMVIISPYARAGYTDHNVASFASLLSFSEYALGVAPLSTVDASAYNYLQAFNFSQPPIPGAAMVRTAEPKASKVQIKAHPPDPNDPT